MSDRNETSGIQLDTKINQRLPKFEKNMRLKNELIIKLENCKKNIQIGSNQSTRKMKKEIFKNNRRAKIEALNCLLSFFEKSFQVFIFLEVKF